MIRYLIAVGTVAASFSMAGFADETTAPGSTTETITDTPNTTTTSTKSGVTNFSCTMGTQTRSIKVEYDSPNAKVPCKVSYTKSDDPAGAAQTPWTAANAEGFCEEKAQGLADKLTTNGWDCKQAM